MYIVYFISISKIIHAHVGLYYIHVRVSDFHLQLLESGNDVEQLANNIIAPLSSDSSEERKAAVGTLYSLTPEQRRSVLQVYCSDHIDSFNVYKATILQFASQYCPPDTLLYILNCVDDNKRLELLYLVTEGKKHFELFGLQTPLHLAALYNKTEAVKFILDSVTADERHRLLSMRGGQERTPLHHAAKKNTAEAVKSILDSVTADERHKLLSMRDVQQWTSLHHAGFYNTAEAVKCILDSVDWQILDKLIHLKSKYYETIAYSSN